ncbi:MAG: ATP-binding cassette domain-containing protein [Isosphaeraceae bacterium]
MKNLAWPFFWRAKPTEHNGRLDPDEAVQVVRAGHGRRDAGPAISVRDLWLTYPSRRRDEPIHVLERVELEVREGEFVCIVGPSGCGKTSLLNIIAGFLHASRGEVLVEGEPVRGPDRRRIFIFQEGGVFPWLTVRENIGFGLDRSRPTSTPSSTITSAWSASRALNGPIPGAVRRDAAACRDRPRTGRGPRDSLHGRAVRGPRLHHAVRSRSQPGIESRR